MRIFMDASALFAYLDQDDDHHETICVAWPALVQQHVPITTNYVLLETHALAQRRLGAQPARELLEVVRPLLTVEWVDAELEEAAIEYLHAAGQRKLSLVDAVSLVVMRRLRLQYAFAFDQHFRERGYVLPDLTTE